MQDTGTGGRIGAIGYRLVEQRGCAYPPATVWTRIQLAPPSLVRQSGPSLRRGRPPAGAWVGVWGLQVTLFRPLSGATSRLFDQLTPPSIVRSSSLVRHCSQRTTIWGPVRPPWTRAWTCSGSLPTSMASPGPSASAPTSGQMKCQCTTCRWCCGPLYNTSSTFSAESTSPIGLLIVAASEPAKSNPTTRLSISSTADPESPGWLIGLVMN